MPSRPSPGSYPGPVQVPSRVIRHVLCFTVFRTHPGPKVGAIPARPGPILLPSVPYRIRPGRAETDFLATSSKWGFKKGLLRDKFGHFWGNFSLSKIICLRGEKLFAKRPFFCIPKAPVLKPLCKVFKLDRVSFSTPEWSPLRSFGHPITKLGKDCGKQHETRETKATKVKQNWLITNKCAWVRRIFAKCLILDRAELGPLRLRGVRINPLSSEFGSFFLRQLGKFSSELWFA